MARDSRATPAASRNKSREVLYNLIDGVKTHTSAAGRVNSTAGTFVWATGGASDGDQVVIGGKYFEFDSAGEAAGTSAGTAADPHLVDQGSTIADTVDNLETAALAEFAADADMSWGVLHPVLATGISSDGVDTLSITNFPGVTVTLSDPVDTNSYCTVTQPVGGAVAPVQLDLNVASNRIEMENNTDAVEYYELKDGSEGQEMTIYMGTMTNSGSDAAGIMVENMLDLSTPSANTLITMGDNVDWIVLKFLNGNWREVVSSGVALT